MLGLDLLGISLAQAGRSYAATHAAPTPTTYVSPTAVQPPAGFASTPGASLASRGMAFSALQGKVTAAALTPDAATFLQQAAPAAAAKILPATIPTAPAASAPAPAASAPAPAASAPAPDSSTVPVPMTPVSPEGGSYDDSGGGGGGGGDAGGYADTGDAGDSGGDGGDAGGEGGDGGDGGDGDAAAPDESSDADGGNGDQMTGLRGLDLFVGYVPPETHWYTVATPGAMKDEMDKVMREGDTLNADITSFSSNDPTFTTFRTGWVSFWAGYKKFYDENSGWFSRLSSAVGDQIVAYGNQLNDWRAKFKQFGGKATEPELTVTQHRADPTKKPKPIPWTPIIISIVAVIGLFGGGYILSKAGAFGGLFKKAAA